MRIGAILNPHPLQKRNPSGNRVQKMQDKRIFGTVGRTLLIQDRITASMQKENGEIVHIRKSTRPEPRQQIIYDALNLAHYPGRTEKSVV